MTSLCHDEDGPWPIYNDIARIFRYVSFYSELHVIVPLVTATECALLSNNTHHDAHDFTKHDCAKQAEIWLLVDDLSKIFTNVSTQQPISGYGDDENMWSMSLEGWVLLIESDVNTILTPQTFYDVIK